MKHRYLAAVVVVGVAMTACGDGKSPVAPAANVTGLTITLAADGPIYIGAATQLQATETLSDGTTRAAAPAWSSDTPTVATVSQAGIVTATGAGETTIAADSDGRRTTVRIRVYPNVNGTWSGIESFSSCDDSGVFEGVCSEPDFYTQGEQFRHDSRYIQTNAAVDVTIDLGDGILASGSGVVTVPGELQLSSARAVPEDSSLTLDIQDLRFRSDVPARLTGTYLLRLSVPGVAGSVALGLRLDGVTRTAVAATASQRRRNADNGAVGSRMDSLRRRLGPLALVARGTRPT